MKKLIVFYIFICSFFLYGADSLEVQMNPKETNWIKQNFGKEIEVVYTGKQDFFCFRDEKTGYLQGVYPDFFKKISDDIGVKFNFRYLDRLEYKDKLKNYREWRIFLKASKTQEREIHYNFKRMFDSYLIVLIGITPIKDIEDIKDKKIGVISGTSEERLFKKQFPEIKLISYTGSVEEIQDMLENGEIDLFLGKNNYFRDWDKEIFNIPEIGREYYNMAISKSSGELTNIIEKYMEHYEKRELIHSIYDNNKLISRQNYGKEIDSFKEKMSYDKLVVLLPADTNLLPFYKTEKGNITGYIATKYRSLEEILGIPIEFVYTPKDSKEKTPYHNIKAISFFPTKDYVQLHPYYNTSRIIIGRGDSKYVIDKTDLKDSKVGVKENIQQTVSDLEYDIYSIETYEDGMKLLLSGKIDYMIGEFRVLQNLMISMNLGDKIKVAGVFAEKFPIFQEIKADEVELIEIIKKTSLDYLGETHVMKISIAEGKNVNLRKYQIFLFYLSFTLIILTYLFIENKKNKKKRKEEIEAVLSGLDVANSLRDNPTYEISEKIGDYAGLISKKLDMKKDYIEKMKKFAGIYDIGKIGVAEKLLKDSHKFMHEDIEKFKKHVEIGYDLVKKMQLGPEVENMVRYHHEKWDGTGYPLGLKGENIPLEARIIALCESYELLRMELEHEEVVKVMKSLSGKDLDPILVDLFLKINREFEKIYGE